MAKRVLMMLSPWPWPHPFMLLDYQHLSYKKSINLYFARVIQNLLNMRFINDSKSIIAIGLMPFYGWIAHLLQPQSLLGHDYLISSWHKNVRAIGNLLNFQNQNFYLLFYPLSLWIIFMGANSLLKNDVSSILERIIFAIFLILLGVVTYTATAVFLGGINLKEPRASIKKG